jgi:hypothetical protein
MRKDRMQPWQALGRVALAALLLLFVSLAADEVSGQPDRISPGLAEAKTGAACYDPADRRVGVFKHDPCGRLYCGDPKLKSITDVRPNYAAEKKCEWQMVSWRCQCVGGASLAKKAREK